LIIGYFWSVIPVNRNHKNLGHAQIDENIVHTHFLISKGQNPETKKRQHIFSKNVSAKVHSWTVRKQFSKLCRPRFSFFCIKFSKNRRNKIPSKNLISTTKLSSHQLDHPVITTLAQSLKPQSGSGLLNPQSLTVKWKI